VLKKVWVCKSSNVKEQENYRLLFLDWGKILHGIIIDLGQHHHLKGFNFKIKA
jgi:hypothetical protein